MMPSKAKSPSNQNGGGGGVSFHPYNKISQTIHLQEHFIQFLWKKETPMHTQQMNNTKLTVA